MTASTSPPAQQVAVYSPTNSRLPIRLAGLLAVLAALLATSRAPADAAPPRQSAVSSPLAVLTPESFRDGLGGDREWIVANAPLFECPDAGLQQIYYFRWHVYHEHLKQTPAGWVVTEFLPDVPWAGRYNTISCAAGHHLREGRWLRDRRYVEDYCRFWFRGARGAPGAGGGIDGGEPRRYSFWAADSVYAVALATGDKAMAVELLPALVANYEAWEKTHRDDNGLFWQIDDRDGMEYSIGGSGYRPTINAYQYGDAVAIAEIAGWAGKAEVAADFRARAAKLKALVQEKLWDRDARFFKTLPRAKDAKDGKDAKDEKGAKLVDVREEVGFVPWYFNLPDPGRGYEAAWKQLTDPDGFSAPFGPPTAERRSPRFNFPANHDCLWNGPSWPFATTQTLVALANVLNGYEQDVIGKGEYFALLANYARSQHKDGHPWVAEDLDAYTGKWIVDLPRSVDYNHSGFCDPVITGLAGLRPRPDDTVEVNPLISAGKWDWFCLDGVPYHGRSLTILYDKSGDRYHRGKGLRVLADGQEVVAADDIRRVQAPLPRAALKAPAPRAAAAPDRRATDAASDRGGDSTAAGWVKYEHNPVLGGSHGTCFDVALLKEGDTFRMYFSWRPEKSIALVESKDGIHWNEPLVVLGPNDKTDWESDVNRPVVVKARDGYHMWYTGQARGHSWIGYATSGDGKEWKRQSDKPALSPDQPWEKVAVMCPHVMWDERAKQYRMWYSGGEQYEPDAIGYATSGDGLKWEKFGRNPIFAADPATEWEKHKVTACQVVRRGDWHLMFYIGFRDVNHAQIGVARSRDGITGWQRLPANPIIRPGQGAWDSDACYKPFAIYDEGAGRWMLWYNGRRGGAEQIGLATHDGEGLPFGDKTRN